MNTSQSNVGSPPDSVYAIWAINAAAYIVLIVYSVTGEPDYEQWDAPKLVVSIGQVPEVAF